MDVDVDVDVRLSSNVLPSKRCTALLHLAVASAVQLRQSICRLLDFTFTRLQLAKKNVLQRAIMSYYLLYLWLLPFFLTRIFLLPFLTCQMKMHQ